MFSPHLDELTDPPLDAIDPTWICPGNRIQPQCPTKCGSQTPAESSSRHRMSVTELLPPAKPTSAMKIVRITAVLFLFHDSRGGLDFKSTNRKQSNKSHSSGQPELIYKQCLKLPVLTEISFLTRTKSWKAIAYTSPLPRRNCV